MWDYWPILKERASYLRGEEFSNNLVIPFSKGDGIHLGPDTKNEWLSEVVRGHTALHVGCVDHLPVLKEKMAKGSWLHAQLVAVASRCVGLDLSEEGIKVLHGLGVKDVFACDVTDEAANQSFRKEHWDYILVPDVIEHLPQPAGFLSSLASLWGKDGGRLIVTVPNEVCFLTFRDALQSRGVVNSDHRHAYSLYTLVQLVMSSGWEVEQAGFLSTFKMPWSKPLRRLMLASRPAMSNVLVVVARYSSAG